MPPAPKVVFLGAYNVGKSSVILRYAHDRFFDHQTSSAGASFQIKQVSIKGKNHSVQIWDTAGHERFQEMARLYYDDADGVVIVYDASDLKTLDQARQLYAKVVMSNFNARMLVLGNKIDLLSQDQIDQARIAMQEKFKGININLAMVSAKLGVNIQQCLDGLVTQLVDDDKQRTKEKDKTSNKRRSCFDSCRSRDQQSDNENSDDKRDPPVAYI